MPKRLNYCTSINAVYFLISFYLGGGEGGEQERMEGVTF